MYTKLLKNLLRERKVTMETDYILKNLEKKINDKKRGYNHDSIISWFNGEQKYKKRYKGREILEIIQNAEDAKADELIFTINHKCNKIIISNNGENFSLAGYSSLLYPDLSPKPKGIFIGQKGLGFRALINWANEISIISNNLKVTFSDKISRDLLLELKAERDDLSDVSQMQFLSLPDVQKIDSGSKGVTFELQCKDDINFEKQFERIDKECLLFLKNIKLIKTPISIIQKENLEELIIEEKTEELPEKYYEKEELESKEKRKIYYNIKLIWNPKRDYENYPLYCYFKTNVKIGSPVLIHAGFDLSDDRNSIEDTQRNKFLVEEICKSFENLIDKISLKYNDWSSYKLVNHYIQCQKDSVFENLRYSFNYIKQNKSIYPTIDNKLKTFNEIVVLDNEITEFIITLKQKYKNILFHEFNNVVKPIYDEEIHLNINKEKYYEIFNLLSKKLPVNDINERCILIKLFHKYANDFCLKKPAIFIDNNNEIIPEEDKVFSHRDDEIDENLIPSFCKYRTINFNLNRKLINKGLLTQEEIDSCINKVCSGNITNIFLILIDYITLDTNELQKKDIYLNLFKMYKKYGDKISIPENYPIKILCDDGNYYFENIIFNYGFNSNDKILEIIKDFIKENNNIHCIQTKQYWSFLGATDIELRGFFKFLRVSDYVNYDILSEEADLFLSKLTKEQIVKLAILDNKFYDFIKFENRITKLIKSNNLFTDYVINTKKIRFLNNGLLDRNIIKNITNDEHKINIILKNLGAQETIETISGQRFNDIIKNLYKWDADGEFAGRIYDQAFKNKVKIKGETLYFSKDRAAYLKNKELYYYDNKCLPASKLKEFPTIDLGRRKGHEKVSELFNIKSIETYKVKILGKPDIDDNLTTAFIADLRRFYHLILAYRFCSAASPLSEEMKKEQANSLKNIDIKICKNLEYTLNNELNKEVLQDFDFVNTNGVFYLKVPQNCKNIYDIRKHKKELYDFISEMLLMTFKLTENNSYIKDTAVQTYIFNDLSFSVSRFEDDNDRTILREAEDLLNITNYREEFWKHIWQIKNIDEPYELWEYKQNTKKIFSTLDYTVYNDDMAAIFDEEDVLINKKEFFNDYAFSNSINFIDYNQERFRDLYNHIKNDIDKYIWFLCNKKKDKQVKYLEKLKKAQWDISISELFYSCNYYIEDYEKEMWHKLKEIGYNKDVIYDVINQNSITEKVFYDSNCSKYTEKELDTIKQRYDMSSLLYFENTEDRISEFLENYNKNKIEHKSIQNNLNEINQENIEEWPEFDFKENKYSYLCKKSNSKNKKTTYSSIEQSINDIQKGKLVEQLATELLNKSKSYSNVKNVSELGYGYDIECVENATTRTLYIEVKSFEKDYFEMTENEYKKWEKNKNIYKIFLLDLNTKHQKLINGEELENYFNIETSKYRCTMK